MAEYYQPSTTTGDDTSDQNNSTNVAAQPPADGGADSTGVPAQGAPAPVPTPEGTPVVAEPAPQPDIPTPPEPAPLPPVPPAPPETPMEQPASGGGTQDAPTPSYDGMVDQLVKQLGFENVQEPQKTDLVDSIKERIETRVLRVLMTSLTEEQTKKMEEKINQEKLDEKAIINLLSREAPNAAATIVSALDDLYMEMKEEVDTLNRAAGAVVADKQP